MAIFVDSGILLRALHRSDPFHSDVRSAVRKLIQRQTPLFTGLQHLAAFWNVCARPPGERGGFNLSVSEAYKRLTRISRGVNVVTETPLTPDYWCTLVQRYAVKGVQVHDARTVALMLTYSVTDLLTLNKGDFARYASEGIVAVTPVELLASVH